MLALGRCGGIGLGLVSGLGFSDTRVDFLFFALGLVWFGLVWFGLDWFDLVRFGWVSWLGSRLGWMKQGTRERERRERGETERERERDREREYGEREREREYGERERERENMERGRVETALGFSKWPSSDLQK